MPTITPAFPVERFRALCEAAPEAPALIDGRSGAILDRRSLLDEASVIAGALAQQNVGAGDLIVLRMPNSPELVASILACWITRAAVAPVDRDATDPELDGIVHHLGARGHLRLANGHVDLVRSTVAPISYESIALVKLSSGSTGKAKGIVTTAANLVADCANITRSMGISGADVNLGAIPMTHSYGFSNLVMPLLLEGTPVVHTNDYLPLSLLEICNSNGVTVLPGIPMMFEHLASLPEHDGRLRTVRLAISAGAPLTAGTSQRFRERHGVSIHTFYGASECGGITYDREGGAVERGDVGRALDGVTLSIDPIHGTLVVESGAVAAGYVDPGGDDARRFVGGTYRTDDMAEIDGHGTVRLTGRAGDVIIVAGRKVNPREVESALMTCEGVRDARVYGEPAGARGEVVAAVVVASNVTRDAIRAHCRGVLSTHKVPRVIRFVDEIPVDARGKVRRSELRALGSRGD